MNYKLDIRLAGALALYLVSLLAANTLGMKLMPFFFGTHLSVAVFFFPFVFLTTDVVGQVYGRETARSFVFAGSLATAAFMIYAALAVALPWSGASEQLINGYSSVYSASLRMSLASLLAFVIGEYQDVAAFFFFKARAGHRFWLQSSLSNLWSQLVDTAIFMVVAFSGIYPIRTIVMAGLPWWLYKVLAGAAYTPLSYLGLKVLRYREIETV